MIGTRIAHYHVVDKLGQGGMGEVFLAQDTKLDRRVALKFLPASMWHEPDAKERLLREAKAASQLDHPNIVTIHGIEESEGRPFIQMAYVRGAPLDEYCRATKPGTAELLGLAMQIADGLSHAHTAGVVHRDLKPSNILVDDSARVRILDFGVASMRGATKLTKTGTTVGTLSYAPPEIIQGDQATAASDIYSLGVVLYEMLSGRVPHEAEHEAALLYAILNAVPRPLSELGIDVTPELQCIVSRCLEKQPSKRYPNAASLLEELKKVATGPAMAGESVLTPSLAVLPFSNLSTDAENEYFSDGLTEELLNVLAKSPGLMVTGRTSSFAFKGKNEDLREIGQKLGVSALLEGSVRKAGNRVRITAQLVKASDGFHMWSETYDRVLDDIFAVQDEIAQAVAEQLSVALLGPPQSKARGSAEVFDLVLRAKQQMLLSSGESLAKAARLFGEALAKAPDDARAWAGLGRTFLGQSAQGYLPVREGYSGAREAIEKALYLDDSLADAHEAMGWMVTGFEYRFSAAEQSFRRAVELEPGNGQMLSSLAQFMGVVNGDFDEAIRLSERAIEIDPLSPQLNQYHARLLLWGRKYEASLASYRRTLELSPNLINGHSQCALVLSLLGRPQEGIAEAKQETTVGYRSTALAIAYHMLGDADAAQGALEALIAEGEDWAIQIAVTYAVRGQADKAFDWLNRAYFLRDTGVPVISTSPLLASLHGDPRWKPLLERVGFAV